MTKENKKCPNCGHEFKKGEEYCPNCDLFVPVNEQNISENTFDPHATKKFKAFNEKDIEKKVEDDFEEPTFKHRNKPVEETVTQNSTSEKVNESSKESEILKETAETTNNEEVKSTSEISESVEEKEEIIPTEVPQDNLDKEIAEELDNKNEELEAKTLPEPVAPEIEASTESNRSTENGNNKKKKARAIIGMSAAVVLIGGGIVFYSAQQKKAEEKATTELVSTAELDLNSLYSTSEHVFLKEDISSKDIDKAKKSLDKLKGKDDYNEMKKEFDRVEEKYNKQTAINDLFKSPIIEGDKLDTKTFVKNEDHISINKIATEKDGFDILYNKAFAEAESQKKLLTEANEALETVIKGDDVVKSATRDQVSSAEKTIKAVKDPEAKKKLQEKLDKVKSYLDKAEKEQAQAAEEEQARLAQQQQQQNNQTTQNNNNGNYKNTDSSQKWGNRKDDYIDYGDAAWGWNPGVQEKVISEVINRGYVVDGGYSLVPKYVENGEGYYDLYATTNSKIFPKSKPEEFPLYVVTINAKTGWFKGNGPN